MTVKVEVAVRGPEAYSLARNVIAEMESVGVWPTPLNFELWLHYLGDPEGALGQEMNRLLTDGADFTEGSAPKPQVSMATWNACASLFCRSATTPFINC